MNRPNILFYFTDQQRADTLGCYGQKLDISPNLDKLAAEGVLFENAFTAQPVSALAGRCFRQGVILPRLIAIGMASLFQTT